MLACVAGVDHMSTGFVLVLLREIRESIVKLQQEFNARQDQVSERQNQIDKRLARLDEHLHQPAGHHEQGADAGQADNSSNQTDDRLAQLNEQLDQTLGSLARVESDLHELRKYMRQIALNQAKHEHLHTQGVITLDNDVRELKEQLRLLQQGR